MRELAAGKPATADMPLDAALACLGAHPDVRGVVLFGSTGGDEMTPVSDFDVLVVLEGLDGRRVQVTHVDGRLTDVIFVGLSQLRRLAEMQWRGWDGDDRRLAGWLVAGRIVSDRSGILEGARVAAVCFVESGDMVAQDEIEAAWSHVNYDLAINRRYGRSEGPVYALALELRSLHVLWRIVESWFVVRGRRWEGEKKAVTVLADEAPGFLDVVRSWLCEADAERRVELIERAAALALAPVGGLWAEGTVALGDGIWEWLIGE